jgi:acyl-coenzyme A synthetase/AMP-(fatty) acid ligase
MHFPLAPDDRTLNMTPWFHRGGLYSGGPNPVFYVGAAAISLRAFDPAAVLDLVAARGLTFLIGAPTNLAMLAEEQRRAPRNLATLRGIVTMGAPLERASWACSTRRPSCAADLQRLRHHRVVLEHLPAPGRPAHARRLGGPRLHRRRRGRRPLRR